tara:strand:- start:466 stop:1086 length:621 start_codon:yes stop_codon:yes gene_type:complete
MPANFNQNNLILFIDYLNNLITNNTDFSDNIEINVNELHDHNCLLNTDTIEINNENMYSQLNNIVTNITNIPNENDNNDDDDNNNNNEDDDHDNNNEDEDDDHDNNNEDEEYIILTFKIPRDNSSVRKKLSHLGTFKKIKENDPLVINKEHCSICFQPFIEGEFKRTLSECKHTFHKKCVDKWLVKSKNMSCPICRHSYFKNVIPI